MKRTVQISMLLLLGFMTVTAQGTLFSFRIVEPFNCLQDKITGETYLSLEVLDAGGGLVDFIFRNDDPLNSSIHEVYFDDNVGGSGSNILSNYNKGVELIKDINIDEYDKEIRKSYRPKWHDSAQKASKVLRELK